MTVMTLPENPDHIVRERRGWIAGVIGAALLGFAAGNGHTTQGAISHVSDQLGQEKAAENCQHKRADKAVKVANQGIVSNYIVTVPIPDPAALPKDCPAAPKK